MCLAVPRLGPWPPLSFSSALLWSLPVPEPAAALIKGQMKPPASGHQHSSWGVALMTTKGALACFTWSPGSAGLCPGGAMDVFSSEVFTLPTDVSAVGGEAALTWPANPHASCEQQRVPSSASSTPNLLGLDRASLNINRDTKELAGAEKMNSDEAGGSYPGTNAPACPGPVQ